ncbi:hypothetical protein [Paraburkholderia sp. J94]|uniref:hypothetical protein n=1 Tax=Paraburkholderia sp. J94 TaxID=2805441 RepID=UPI002AB0A564|nr:hypothetical protein [Paraburkholderia sp. J94]
MGVHPGFQLTDTAKLAIEAAFSTLVKNAGLRGWAAGEFASNLTAWLISENLMPVHVAPGEFTRFIKAQATAVLAR